MERDLGGKDQRQRTKRRKTGQIAEDATQKRNIMKNTKNTNGKNRNNNDAIGQKWVKLNRYCEMSGDTSDAVHAKRKKGIWLDGVQCRIAPDRRLWINVEAVNNWVESSRAGVIQ